MSKRLPQRIVATHIFFVKGNQVLLSVRKNTGYMDGYYSVISGHIEANEEIIEATIREIREEVGVKVTEKDLKFCHVMDRLEDDERIDFFFICRRWQRKLKNNEPDKCERLEWHDMQQLPRKTIPYIRQAIQQIQKGSFFSILHT